MSQAPTSPGGCFFTLHLHAPELQSDVRQTVDRVFSPGTSRRPFRIVACFVFTTADLQVAKTIRGRFFDLITHKYVPVDVYRLRDFL